MPRRLCGFQFEYAYRWFDIKDDAPLLRRDACSQPTTRPTSWTSTIGSLAPAGSAVRPYIIGGPGFYNRKVEITEYVGNGVICDPYWYYVCGTYPVEAVIGSRGGWDFGFNFGGGVGFGIGEASEFFVEMRYHYVGDRSSTRRQSARQRRHRRQRQRHATTRSRSDSVSEGEDHEIFLAAAALVLLLPALALAQKTSFDFDKTADFSKFKTYTLKDGTKVGDPLVDNRIVAAIEAEIAAKGLTRNDAMPDVVVVYHIAFDKKQDITAFSSGYGGYGYRYGRRLGHDDDNVRVNEILVGTLVIDVAEPPRSDGVARHGRQGSRRPGEGREARQEHHLGGEEDPQGLPTQEEGVRGDTDDARRWFCRAAIVVVCGVIVATGMFVRVSAQTTGAPEKLQSRLPSTWAVDRGWRDTSSSPSTVVDARRSGRSS